MNEQELLFLVSVTVIMPILALWIIVSYQKTRLKYKKTQTDDSLTTSELNTLIEDSVATATAPLLERIEAMESRLEAGRIEIDLQEESGQSVAQSDAPTKTLGKSRA